MYQSITIIGNVGGDPVLSYTPQGVAVAKFTVAVSKKWGKGDQRQEKTTWFRVTVWRESAEVLVKYVRKGSKIMVVGEIAANAYTDRNGQLQASLELTANEFKFLDSRSDDDNRQPAPAAAGANGHRPLDPNAEEPDQVPF